MTPFDRRDRRRLNEQLRDLRRRIDRLHAATPIPTALTPYPATSIEEPHRG